MPSTKPVLAIQIIHSWHDCEDCGSSQDDEAEVTFPDGSTLNAYHDGHLGGGNWNGDMATLYTTCLVKLGVETRINNTVFPQGLAAHDFDAACDDFEGHYQVALAGVTKTIVEIDATYIPEPDSPSYIYPTRVEFNLMDGGRAVLTYGSTTMDTAPDNWDGDWGAVWRMILADRFNLQEIETETDYEPLDYDDENEDSEVDEES